MSSQEQIDMMSALGQPSGTVTGLLWQMTSHWQGRLLMNSLA